jgi:peptide/nickel transport system ATP-binding protein
MTQPCTEHQSTMTSPATSPLVQVQDLKVRFTRGPRPVDAVNGVDLQLNRGEVLALIGESGSGKSVTLRSLLRLHPPKNTRLSGSMIVDGEDVLALAPKQLSAYRGGKVAMIFQEPLTALDPVYTVGDQIVESILRHEQVSRTEARNRALELFERVRIPSPERRLAAYPHEMSGGMRQRAMIALALACRPQLLLADEPTTALDATVQIQVLLLLRELQRELGLAVIFVTHDLGVAVEVADRIAVMYAGRIVEEGNTRDVIRSPAHPYTVSLLRSRAEGSMARGSRLRAIAGSPPDLSDLPTGCAFAERCFMAEDACRASQPGRLVVAPEHFSMCLRSDSLRTLAKS